MHLVSNSALHGRCHYFIYTMASWAMYPLPLFLFFFNIALNQHSIKALVINTLSSTPKGMQAQVLISDTQT